MTIQEFIEKNYPNGCSDWMLDVALKNFAVIKCQKLLLLVAEKAKTEKKYFPHELGGLHKQVGTVDKDSILKAVDLETFIV